MSHLTKSALFNNANIQLSTGFYGRLQGNNLIDDIGNNALVGTSTMTKQDPIVAGVNADFGGAARNSSTHSGWVSETALIPIGDSDPFTFIVAFAPLAAEVSNRTSEFLSGMILDCTAGSALYGLQWQSGPAYDFIQWAQNVNKGNPGTQVFEQEYTGDDLIQAGDVVLIAVSVAADGSGFFKRYGFDKVTFGAGAFTSDFRDSLVQTVGRQNNASGTGLQADWGPIIPYDQALDEAQVDDVFAALVAEASAVIPTSSSTSGGNTVVKEFNVTINGNFTKALAIDLTLPAGLEGDHTNGMLLTLTDASDGNNAIVRNYAAGETHPFKLDAPFTASNGAAAKLTLSESIAAQRLNAAKP